MAKVNADYRVTIPKEIKAALGVKSGGKIEFSLENNHLILRKRSK